MPVFKQSISFEVLRKIRVFLNLEAGVVRDRVPQPETVAAAPKPSNGPKASTAPSGNQETARQDARLRRLRNHLDEKEQENARLREQLAEGSYERLGGYVKPENMIWIFGFGRSGSSWLISMMVDLEGYASWDEPYVGEIFGTAYYLRVGDRQRNREAFALGDSFVEARINSIRSFVLEGAAARFPGLAKDGYLVIKEPNGSIGAPLLMEALPESRMILLVRDPRDVVSSVLAANRKGSWASQWKPNGSDGESLADTNPVEFVRRWASAYVVAFGKAKEAYEAHGGPKVVVRYEELRTGTLETMKRIYSTLDIPVNEAELVSAVHKHAWENVPEKKKGADKTYRKATPGSWREDLTPQQAEIVEEITEPFLKEYYSD